MAFVLLIRVTLLSAGFSPPSPKQRSNRVFFFCPSNMENSHVLFIFRRFEFPSSFGGFQSLTLIMFLLRFFIYFFFSFSFVHEGLAITMKQSLIENCNTSSTVWRIFFLSSLSQCRVQWDAHDSLWVWFNYTISFLFWTWWANVSGQGERRDRLAVK